MIFSVYNYKQIVTLDIIKLLIKDINYEIDTNEYKNVPGTQTKSILQLKKGIHWDKIKETLVNSLIKCLKPKEIIISKMWAYLDKVNKPSISEWHIHKDSNYSAVMYLQFPKQEQLGTIFRIRNDIYQAPGIIANWIIFPSNIIHKPPVWNYNNADKDRITLAVTLTIK